MTFLPQRRAWPPTFPTGAAAAAPPPLPLPQKQQQQQQLASAAATPPPTPQDPSPIAQALFANNQKARQQQQQQQKTQQKLGAAAGIANPPTTPTSTRSSAAFGRCSPAAPASAASAAAASSAAELRERAAMLARFGLADAAGLDPTDSDRAAGLQAQIDVLQGQLRAAQVAAQPAPLHPNFMHSRPVLQRLDDLAPYSSVSGGAQVAHLSTAAAAPRGGGAPRGKIVWLPDVLPAAVPLAPLTLSLTPHAQAARALPPPRRGGAQAHPQAHPEAQLQAQPSLAKTKTSGRERGAH